MIYTTPDFGRTLDRCMEKIYDQLRGNLNLAVDLAESAQTIRMLRNAVSLKKFVTRFSREVVKHRKFKSIPKGPTQSQRQVDYVTRKWLEGRYGWMPLIRSIYDAAEQLRKRLEARTITVKARSGVKKEEKLNPLSGWADGWYGGLENYFSSYRTEVGCVFNMPDDTYSLANWTSLNPLAIAWELTPYSFIADWFLNVSQYLDGWENKVLYDRYFRGGYVTHSYVEHYTYFQVYTHDVPYTFWPDGQAITGGRQSAAQSGYRRASGKDRQLLLSLPIPSGLRIDVNLNAKRMLDTSALIWQQVVRFRK
jgi:hypothetical protein